MTETWPIWRCAVREQLGEGPTPEAAPEKAQVLPRSIPLDFQGIVAGLGVS